MDQELQLLFEAAEEKREALIAKVRKLPVNAQAKRASPKEWSPLEVVEHCRVTEALYEQMAGETDLKQIEGKRATRHPILKMITWSMRRAIRAPSMPMFEPQAAPPLEEVEKQWSEQRARLKALVEKAGPNEPVLKHKMFGPMSGLQILNVIDAHMHYHLTRFPRTQD